MKRYTILGLLILLSMQTTAAFSQTGVSKDSILKVIIDGNEIVLEKVVEGETVLYRQTYQDEDLFETLEILSPVYETKYRYFIGGEEIVAIDDNSSKWETHMYGILNFMEQGA